MNILLHIQYIGTHYSGWQKQHNAVSIQHILEQAIYSLTGEQVKLIGSGRTDAGVHALGQMANFHTKASIPAEKWALALNSHLPEDIGILQSQEVPSAFHARFDARGKTYLYRIYSGKIHPVLERNRSAFVREELNATAMKSALKEFVGTHDFSAFCAAGSSATSNRRTVLRAELRSCSPKVSFPGDPSFFQRELAFADPASFQSEASFDEPVLLQEEAFSPNFLRPQDKEWTLFISGNGFLYNMVRILAGTLIEIGKGKEYSIAKALQSGKREDAGPTAPPWGLYLLQVHYPKSIFQSAW